MAIDNRLRVLIFGANGMLGHKLLQVLSPVYNTYGTVRNRNYDNPIINKYQLIKGIDLLDDYSIIDAIQKCTPDVVINCIGITDKELCATDWRYAYQVNTTFPHTLYYACQKYGCRFIHISTDCVFDGRKGDYIESDIPEPVDNYGRSKLYGEVVDINALTIRTSFIGKELDSHRGLLEWFLRHKNGAVPGYNKAIFTGFPTITLAKIFRDIIIPSNITGLYQVACEPINKYQLLKLIDEALELNVKISKYNGFQCDRSLNCRKFIRDTGFSYKPWPVMIAELAEDINSYSKVLV